MNTIDILIEGYAKMTDTGWEASSTTCLITCTNPHPVPAGRQATPLPAEQGEGDQGEIKIIVDPGANRDLLFERLKEKGIQLEDISYVFLTHHHLDHAMNAGLFPKAKVVDEEAIYTQDKAVEGVKMIPDTDITILPTPGHEAGHGILVVPTKDGTVVVAGDNFWWPSYASSDAKAMDDKKASEGQAIDVQDKEKLLNRRDDFAEDMEVLKASRKQVLDLADWIVPGHGKPFENKR